MGLLQPGCCPSRNTMCVCGQEQSEDSVQTGDTNIYKPGRKTSEETRPADTRNLDLWPIVACDQGPLIKRRISFRNPQYQSDLVSSPKGKEKY